MNIQSTAITEQAIFTLTYQQKYLEIYKTGLNFDGDFIPYNRISLLRINSEIIKGESKNVDAGVGNPILYGMSILGMSASVLMFVIPIIYVIVCDLLKYDSNQSIANILPLALPTFLISLIVMAFSRKTKKIIEPDVTLYHLALSFRSDPSMNIYSSLNQAEVQDAHDRIVGIVKQL